MPTVWQGVRVAIEKRGIDRVSAILKLRTLTCGGSSPLPEMMKRPLQLLTGWHISEQLEVLGDVIAWVPSTEPEAVVSPLLRT